MRRGSGGRCPRSPASGTPRRSRPRIGRRWSRVAPGRTSGTRDENPAAGVVPGLVIGRVLGSPDQRRARARGARREPRVQARQREPRHPRARESGFERIETLGFASGVKPITDASDLRRLVGWLGTTDVVHVHRGKEHWLAAMANRLSRTPRPLVRTRHIVQPIRPHALNRWLYRQGDQPRRDRDRRDQAPVHRGGPGPAGSRGGDARRCGPRAVSSAGGRNSPRGARWAWRPRCR